MIKAGAIIVGDRHGPAAAVHDIAADLGFSFVVTYAGKPMLDFFAGKRTPCVFLFAELPDPLAYRPVVREIRLGARRALSDAAMIYFAESPSRSIVSACAELGMNDVMTMPFTRERLYMRLMRHIDCRPVSPPKAAGPDRRRPTETAAGPRQTAPARATGRAQAFRA